MTPDKKNEEVDWSKFDFQPLFDEAERKKEEEYQEFLSIRDELQEDQEEEKK